MKGQLSETLGNFPLLHKIYKGNCEIQVGYVKGIAKGKKVSALEINMCLYNEHDMDFRL